MQFLTPSADITDGAWSPSAGADNFAVVDELSSSDADYTSVSSNSTLRIGLAGGSAPSPGTRTLRYRASGRPDKRLLVRLLEAGSTIQSWSTDPLPSSVTQYAQTVTASVSNYADLQVEFESADATSPPTPTASFGAAGAIAVSSGAGTSVTPAYPSGITSGQCLILIVGQKPSTANSGSVTTPGGWTSQGSLTGAGGYGSTLGADTGNTNLHIFTKTADGSETGNLTVTVGTNDVCWAVIIRCTANTGSTSWTFGFASGSDTSGDGSVSIAMSSNPGTTAGDLVIGAMVIPTDVTTPSQFSSQAFSQTGATFGTVTELGEADSGTGNDIGGFVCYAQVSTGTGSANPTMTATAGGTTTNVRGPGAILRVRAGAYSGEMARVTWAQLEIPDAPSTGTAAGTSSASGVGASMASGTGASAGSSTVDGVAIPIASGLSQGVSSAHGVALVPGTPTMLNVSAVATFAIGTPAQAAEDQLPVGAAAGTSTAAGTGQSLFTGTGAAVGTAAAAGEGRALQLADGSSIGSAAAAGAGASLATGQGQSDGSSGATGQGQAIVQAVGAAAGSSSVAGTGGTGDHLGAAHGTSTAAGQGIALFTAQGGASAGAAAQGQGMTLATGVGQSAGSSTSQGSGSALATGSGSSTGSSTASGSAVGSIEVRDAIWVSSNWPDVAVVPSPDEELTVLLEELAPVRPQLTHLGIYVTSGPS